MSYPPNGNGNGNGHDGHSGNSNGNGNGKAFVLAQPESPEEIRRKKILATMPELRRNCSRDPSLKGQVGAKWLFCQLTDLTFLHRYGGDGFGRIFINVSDLSRIYGHRRDSLKLWRDKLMEAGWIWYREKVWPKSEWGICGVAEKPEQTMPPHFGYSAQMCKGGVTEKPSGSAGNGKNGFSGSNCTVSGQPLTEKPAMPDGGTGRPCTDSVQALTEEPSGIATFCGHWVPENPAMPDGGTVRHRPELRSEGARGTVSIQETPIGDRSLEGGSVCAERVPKPVLTHTIPEFEPLDRKMFPRLRQSWGERQLEFCKGRIEVVNQSRTPVPNGTAIVAAYKARMKEVRAWMAGQV